MRVRIFYFNQELTDFKNEEERLCGTRRLGQKRNTESSIA
jgi:hypothetical protein